MLSPRPVPRHQLLAGYLIISAAVALAHGGALANGFVSFDDDIYVTDNANVREGITGRGVAWAFSLEPRKTYYHPLTWLSLMLDADHHGLERPWGFHLTNLLLHGLTAALLFHALARATRQTGPPLLAALLFAVHPLTVEAVTWITERKSVLSAAFGTASILAWIVWVERPSRPRLAAVAGLQLCSVLSKPTFVVLPALLLLLDAWPLRRLGSTVAAGAPAAGVRWRSLLPLVTEKAPLFAVSAASALATILSTRSSGDPLEPLAPVRSFSLRLANAIASLFDYLSAAVWPSLLTFYRAFPSDVPPSRIAAGLAVVALVSAVAALSWRRAPALAIGWLWFLVAIFPALGFRQAGLWPAWADRFAYVPIMGLAIAVAFGGAEALKAFPGASRAAPAVSLALLLPLTLVTRAQVAVWSNSITLYRHAVAVEPRNPEMLWNFGTILLKHQRLAEAGAIFQRLIEVAPGSAPAHGQLGSALKAELRLPEAEVQLREALRLDPGQHESLFNLAEILRATGRFDEARPLYSRFARSAPPEYGAAIAAARRFAAQ